MMIKNLIFLLFHSVFFIITAFGQEGYQINVNIDGYEEDMLRLGYYFGDKQYVKDSTFVNDEGKFTFNGEDPLEAGVYMIISSPNNNFFEFLVSESEQVIDLNADSPDFAKAQVTTNSKENKIYFDYVNFLKKKVPLKNKLVETFNEVKGTEKESDIKAQLSELDLEVKQKHESIIDQHPNSLAAQFVKARIDPTVPEMEGKDDQEKQEKRYRYFKEHFFDHIDIGNSAMLRSPVLFSKIEYYIDKMTIQIPDSVTNSITEVLDQMEEGGPNFQFFLVYYLNKYAKSKLVGMDAVYVELVDRYYATGKASWTEEEQLAKIVKSANDLKPTLVGKTAPNITVEKESGDRVALHDIDKSYTVMIFWEPDCGHCKKSMPLMKEFYNSHKSKDIEVFALCTKYATYDDDKNITFEEVDKCWKFLDDNHMKEWINTVDPYLQSKYKTSYNIKSTPKIFILDKDKKILVKGIGAEQVAEVMDSIIEQDARRKMEGSTSSR